MKILKYIFFFTALALVYIHMQVKIIDLAYRGKAKEQKIRQLVEENGNETYTILTLKSANHLGNKVLDQNSDLKFIDQNQVLELSLTGPTPPPKPELAKLPDDSRQTPVLSFLATGD